MQLLTIRAAGFTATVDACAQDEGQIWFISLLGSQQAVRALWARLVKGETAYLSEDELAGGSLCWLARDAWGTWRFHGARLPSGAAYHGILAPDLAAYLCDRPDFLLLARTEEEAPALHYRTPRQAVRLLDPGCGTGAALRQLADAVGGETYGIELESERAEEARQVLDHVLHASAFAVRLAYDAFSCLWLNPPYDYDDEVKRLEHAFLTAMTRALCPGGLLVFIAPPLHPLLPNPAHFTRGGLAKATGNTAIQ